MQSTAIKRLANNSMYQNKMENEYPIVEISAGTLKDLMRKNHNEIFPLNAVVRVIGIYNRTTGGKSDTYYQLEVREAEVADRPTDAMTPNEIAAKIDEVNG